MLLEIITQTPDRRRVVRKFSRNCRILFCLKIRGIRSEPVQPKEQNCAGVLSLARPIPVSPSQAGEISDIYIKTANLSSKFKMQNFIIRFKLIGVFSNSQVRAYPGSEREMIKLELNLLVEIRPIPRVKSPPHTVTTWLGIPPPWLQTRANCGDQPPTLTRSYRS